MTDFQETHPVEQRTTTDRRSPVAGVKFDPTINLGHILTFMGMVIAVFTAWMTIDKRVTTLEESRATQVVIDKAQDQAVHEQMESIRATMVDIKRGIEKLGDRWDNHQTGKK
jgi:hypothetical protein